MNPRLTVITRGGRAESCHRGAIAIVRGERCVFRAGDVDASFYPRSAVKPFQALPLLEDGLDRALGLLPREVAITAASHSGDERHVDAVRGLLAKGGVDASALQCGAHAPIDEAVARMMMKEGIEPTALHHNCSGKHAGMLIQAKHAGAPLATYLEPAHAIQLRIRRTLARLAEFPAESISAAVDGCSAPAFALPLLALARAFARFAEPKGLEPPLAEACRRLFDAAIAEPHFLSGRRRFDLAAMKAGGGRVFCKGGAEGVLAIAIRSREPGADALGVAIKVDDGNARGYYRPALMLLAAAGFDPAATLADLPSAADLTIKNHRGLEVGRVEAGEALAELPRSPWTA